MSGTSEQEPQGNRTREGWYEIRTGTADSAVVYTHPRLMGSPQTRMNRLKAQLRDEKRIAMGAILGAVELLEETDQEAFPNFQKNMIAESESLRREFEALDTARLFSAALVLQDLDGRIRFVNRRFEEWHGILAAEVIGKTSSEIQSVIIADAFSAHDRQVLEERQPYQRELPVPFADAELHRVIITRFPVLDDDGELIGLGVMGVDVSERRRLEKATCQTKILEAVSELAGGAAHEFNNIFATILLSADLLQIRLGRDIGSCTKSSGPPRAGQI